MYDIFRLQRSSIEECILKKCDPEEWIFVDHISNRKVAIRAAKQLSDEWGRGFAVKVVNTHTECVEYIDDPGWAEDTLELVKPFPPEVVDSLYRQFKKDLAERN